MSKLEVKEFYTAEELTKYKIPYDPCERKDNKVFKSIINIMFQMVGRSYQWAQAHDKEDLLACDLVVFPSESEYDKFQDVASMILRKQYGMNKKTARREMSWFNLMQGLTFLSERYTDDDFKTALRNKITDYEQRHGLLAYEDGYEKELKKYCDFNL